MKMQKKMFVAFLLVPALAAAQQPADLITARSLRAHMFFLAADEMAGRNATSPEGRIAANYVAAHFMRLGLKPAGDNGTYFQNFDMVGSMTDDGRMGLTAKVGATTRTFQLDHDFFYFFVQSATPTQVEAPVVFLGYGINAPEYGYNDFAGLDLAGKVALVLDREPQANDPRSKFKGQWDTIHSYLWYKVEQVRKTGAAGILVVREAVPRRKVRIPSAPVNNWRPSPKIALADSRFDIPVFQVTREVANQLLAPTGKTADQAQRAIDDSGAPASFDVPNVRVTMVKSFQDRELRHTRNVLGILEGSDPALKDEFVVVSGHYDHVGIVGGRIYRGADDNASGTIGMMEIAEAFVRGNVRPKRSILFAAWEAEERGLLGAFYYVDHPTVPLEKTVANLNMDMIGRDEDSVDWPTPPDHNVNMVNVSGTPYNPQLKEIIDSENRKTGLKLDYKTDVVDPESWFARSDHFCFAIHRVPMVLFNTGEHADYHTENDTWDHINYPKMEKIVRLIFLSTAEVANRPARIEFTP